MIPLQIDNTLYGIVIIVVISFLYSAYRKVLYMLYTLTTDVTMHGFNPYSASHDN